jgi:hypothetical protein
VTAEDLRDLLEAAPRANIAFQAGDGIEATPVAFRFRVGRYWIGIPPADTGPVPGPGELVELLIDNGEWFFDLRGLRVRGPITPADQLPDGASADLAWFELSAERVVA